MTTKVIIEKLVMNGKLRQFVPLLLPDESHKREIFMTNSLYQHIDEIIPQNYGLEYQVKVEQHLTNFARGDKIRGGVHIKEVEPFGNGIWSFRILESPQTRIFGAFIEKDWFIAFYMAKKDNLVGNSYNHNYSYFAKQVKRQWKILFKDKTMLLSRDINYLISNGVNDDGRKTKSKKNTYTRKSAFK